MTVSEGAAERVEARSTVFKKELRLRDLVFTQIILVVGSTWVGTAGKLGPSHLVLWLLATVLFFVPLTIVVIQLNRWRPLEGGLYQWAKLGLSDFAGFFVAFNLWIEAILLMSALGIETATFLSYSFGESTQWMREDKLLSATLSVVIIGLLAACATFGLKLGKWFHNVGGVLRLALYAILLALPIVNLAMGVPLRAAALDVALPTASLFTVNILGNMGFGAFSGFEYVAIFAGETANPGRAIGRSVLIAAPLVLAMFVLGTYSVLAFVPPDEIDLIAPLSQAMGRGLLALGPLRHIMPAVALALAASVIGWGSATFTGITRLPMVAGWDGLLPAWFTKLHPRYKTPTNSIAFIAAVTLAFALVGQSGVGAQEAYQLLAKAGLILYALSYLVMFAIPIVGMRDEARRPAMWLRVVSGSGFAMTLLFVVLAVFPIVSVESSLAFSAKILAIVIGVNLVGAAIFLFARRTERPPGQM